MNRFQWVTNLPANTLIASNYVNTNLQFNQNSASTAIGRAAQFAPNNSYFSQNLWWNGSSYSHDDAALGDSMIQLGARFMAGFVDPPVSPRLSQQTAGVSINNMASRFGDRQPCSPGPDDLRLYQYNGRRGRDRVIEAFRR